MGICSSGKWGCAGHSSGVSRGGHCRSSMQPSSNAYSLPRTQITHGSIALFAPQTASSQTSKSIQVKKPGPFGTSEIDQIGLPGVGGLWVIRVKGDRVCVGGSSGGLKDRMLALDQSLGQVPSGAQLPVFTGFFWLPYLTSSAAGWSPTLPLKPPT